MLDHYVIVFVRKKDIAGERIDHHQEEAYALITVCTPALFSNIRETTFPKT